jgi:hypothetical protein
MAKEYSGYSDAAYMKPRLIDDDDLLPRDDSGGLGFNPYRAQWGDGGRVTGAKAHLSVGDGSPDTEKGDEAGEMKRSRGLRSRKD